LDAGVLTEDELDSAILANTDVGLRGGGGRMLVKRILDLLYGFRKDCILLENEIWVPVVELHRPPAGEAKLTLKRSGEHHSEVGVKLFGIGYGSAGTVALSESVSFPASKSDKLIMIRVLATVTRYVEKSSHRSFNRVDFSSAGSKIAYKLEDIPSTGEGVTLESLDPLEWEAEQTIYLGSAHDSGNAEVIVERSANAAWTMEIGISLDVLSTNTRVKFSCEHSNAVELQYSMPYGYDYLLYRPRGEYPLAPKCAKVTT
jgi:hypothetical protein